VNLSDDQLRARIGGRRWTLHNVPLSPTRRTRPDEPLFWEGGDPRWPVIERWLDELYGNDLVGMTVADLGSLEGGFALALARRGADVLGIEARTANLAKCRIVADAWAPPLALRFEQDDVKHFDRARYGTYDVVLAAGILYHLDRPVAWLRQIADAVRCALILDTHYAPPRDGVQLDGKRGPFGLGPLTQHEGYAGRWYTEYEEGTDGWGDLWAAHSNWQSFWLTEGEVRRALGDAGFTITHFQTSGPFPADFCRLQLCAVRAPAD
jgi:SAM-dependent methyltransferase